MNPIQWLSHLSQTQSFTAMAVCLGLAALAGITGVIVEASRTRSWNRELHADYPDVPEAGDWASYPPGTVQAQHWNEPPL